MQGQRTRLLDSLDNATVDVAIIGGGINGAVTAAALSAAGVCTALVDRGDFSSFTSQESSNLVWGGFKYMQSYEFKLVRTLCQSRNRLTEAYPSQVEPIEFLATFDEDSPYPVWLAGLGAMAYWAIGNFATARPRLLRRSTIESIEPVINTSRAKGGLIYSDAYLPVNDARFTFGFVKGALDRGALTANYTELAQAEYDNRYWTLQLRDMIDGTKRTMRARTIVNATGPWIDVLNEQLGVTTEHRIAHSKGIHLIVPRIGSGERVFAFFDEDERLYYVIPMGDRSVIGTTDTRVDEPTTTVTDEDREFLLRQINGRLDLDKPLTAGDVIAERCGVRPLVVDASSNHEESDWLQLSRKHEIEIDHSRSVVSIFGGKLTDCLNVGEEVLDAVSQLGISANKLDDSWFGEPPAADFDRFQARVNANGEVDDDTAELLWRRYGRRANFVLDRVIADPALAEIMWEDPRYIKAEIVEIGEYEMVARVEDFLRRRTSLSLTEHGEELEDRIAEISELLGIAPAASV
jgi:glycerol-3-phosphate dehydrogenase